MTIKTCCSDVFVIGTAVGTNVSLGGVLANGAVNGGRINLQNGGGQQINAGQTVAANGGTGTGGMILLETCTPGTGSLAVVNNGFISATNTADDSGIVGINSGAGQNLNLSGTGNILGGEVVRLGNLDQTTLALSPVNAGFITYSQTSILNSLEQNPATPIPPPTPAPPDAASGQSGFDFSIPESASSLSTANVPGTKLTTDITQPPSGTTEDELVHEYVIPNVNKAQFDSGIIAGVSSFNADFDGAYVSQLTSHGIQSGSLTEGSHFDLNKGNILFSPNHDITVGTHEGIVHIAANSLVFVMETGNDVAVYNLHDDKKGGVTVHFGEKFITLTPGKQAVLTRKNTRELDSVNPGFGVGYRNPVWQEVSDGVTACVTEFSIPSAVVKIQPLRQLLLSKDPKARKIADSMLHDAVILFQVTSSSGVYKAQKSPF